MNEALNDRAWKPRIDRLAELLTRPMSVVEVCTLAAKHLKWPHAKTVNVLAAGEKRAFLSEGAKWRVVGQVKRTRQNLALFVPRRACPHCSGEYTPRSGKQVFCSSNCRQAAHVRKSAKWKGRAA